jgi:sterol desaturase/sphingolipid hydroxylase (fatty acid hydroxylase superfamily)/SAM-dependent methyltransferase
VIGSVSTEPVHASLSVWSGAALVAVFLLLAAWETNRPFFGHFQGSVARLNHGLTNVILAGFNILMVKLLFLPLWVLACNWGHRQGIGIIDWLGLPDGSAFVLAIMLLDMWTYWWHRWNHEVQLLWRFHAVHHSDYRMDVTTAQRFHMGEIALSSLLRVPVFVLIGLSIRHVVAYELALGIVVLFHHADISIGGGWDRRLRLLIPTPHMHKVHHSEVREETNSNYTSLFSIWDRLFGTFRMIPNPGNLQLGLEGYDNAQSQALGFLFKMPFIRQRRADALLAGSDEDALERARAYAKFRPKYPPRVAVFLKKEYGLTDGRTVVDIGSGTGLSSLLFLKAGCRVYGIEPDAAMRSVADTELADYDRFVNLRGDCRHVRLPDDIADFLVVAQALQWFDVEEARKECRRLLKDDGWCVLLWNQRPLRSSAFAKEYEHMLSELIPGYSNPTNPHRVDELVSSFLQGGHIQHREFENFHVLNFEGLLGRAMSSSYFPFPEEENYNALMQRLRELYEKYNENGHITFEYIVHLHIGKL